jgi:antitoxin PrlF
VVSDTAAQRKEVFMPLETESTLTVKGQVTIPAEIRDRLDLRPGDKLRFRLSDSGKLTIEARRKRSIFEQIDTLELPPIGRLPTAADIDDAIAEEMAEQEERVRKRPAR